MGKEDSNECWFKLPLPCFTKNSHSCNKEIVKGILKIFPIEAFPFAKLSLKWFVDILMNENQRKGHLG